MSISTLTELLPVGVGFLVTAFTVLFASIKESRQEYTGRVMIVVNVAIWISILHMYGYLLPEPVRFVSESIALYIGIPIATIAALAYLRGDSLPSTFYDITHTLFGSPTLVLLFGFFVLYMAREPLTTVAGSFITSLPPIVQTYVPETWALLLPAWGGLWYYGLYR